MVAEGLLITSYTTSFISFVITILTVLGVYRDLISTLRGADLQIPIMLGNLRQEIQVEKVFLRQRMREGQDEFGVLPGRLGGVVRGNDVRGLCDDGGGGGRRGSGRRRRRESGMDGETKATQAFTRLLEATVRDLWIEFKAVERPFLIKGGLRAKAVEEGDYWGEEDLDPEKGGVVRGRSGRRRRTNRPKKQEETKSEVDEKAEENELRQLGSQYYRTDLTHRWIWWHQKGTVDRLLQDVQRVQIRRMERDLFETDELVKRLVRNSGGGGVGDGNRSGGGGDSGSSSGSGRGGGSRKQSVIIKSRAGSVRSVRMPTPAVSRRGSAATLGRDARQVDERYVVRRQTQSPATTRLQEGEASNTSRRRDTRSGPRVEYEIVRPGPDGTYVVDVDRRGELSRDVRDSYAGREFRRESSRERRR